MILFLCGSRDVLSILEYFEETIDHATKKTEKSDKAQWGIFILDYDIEASRIPRFHQSIDKVINGVFNIRAREPKDLQSDKFKEYVQRVKKQITIRNETSVRYLSL